MAIRFKVVLAEDRSSIYMSRDNLSHLRLSKKYPKGRILNAPKNTLGMMVFKRKCDAYKWIRMNNVCSQDQRIIKVQSYGRGKKPNLLPDFTNIDHFIEDFAKDPKEAIRNLGRYYNAMVVPTGTLCYQKLKVLT